MLLRCSLTGPSEKSSPRTGPGSSPQFPLLNLSTGLPADVSRGAGEQEFLKAVAQGKQPQLDKGDVKKNQWGKDGPFN